ncbi:unnamed protein product [Linum tenue]|uniref:Uncharacterized protein n=1 Tax=Linum tenue TaxID=586396 RepID=A0AAV0JB49_9ROSI|nr:unnamed protein product [Linum tenue]
MGEFENRVACDGGAAEPEGRIEEEEQKLIEDVAMVDFNLLCSTVAMQTQGKWTDKVQADDEEFHDGGASVFRMWEGGVLDLCDDRRIAVESFCCPCYRFGKNMRRAGFGYCFLQATVYLILALFALLNLIAFFVTKRHPFLYLAIGFTVLVGIYLGFFRSQIKQKFNIRGSDSSWDDCFYHIFCPFCALSQEARTLEMNNVQDGTWHGRGDTICVGGYTEGNHAYLQLHPPAIVTTKSSDNSSSSSPRKVSGSEC